MRRRLRIDLPNPVILLLLLLIFSQGCAGPVLQTYPADQKEITTVSKAFLSSLKLRDKTCNCCIDAEVDISLSMPGWFRDHTGKFSAYLQAMEPGYIRLVALNPLGQPWYVFVTDGKMFKSLNIFEEKAYSGSVQSETYNKFAPAGFDPRVSYFWLTGRMPSGDMQIKAVMRDREQDAFWLQINHANRAAESMVLFDLDEMLILRHVLRDERGKHLAEVIYGDYQLLYGERNKDSGSVSVNDPVNAVKHFCRVPGRITISSRAGSEKIEVKLHSFIEGAHFSEENFSLDIADNFQQLLVK